MDSDKISNKELTSKAYLETISCDLCGSKKFKVIYKSKYGDRSIKQLLKMYKASGDDLLLDQLVKCSNCGLIFVNPRIKGNLIVKGYSEGSDELFVSQATSRENTFSRSLNLIEKYSLGKGRLLDVGTAGGSFLAAAKKKGWEVTGCEPNRWLAEWANKNYKIKVSPGVLHDQKYKSNSFDVVTLWDVIEHTPSPSEVLKECNRILKKGGLLVVNYPDIGSIVAKMMKDKWLFLTSVHLYYFNRKTIKGILRKNGFELIKIKPHFQRLKLGYIFFRARKYSKLISQVGSSAVKSVGLEDKEVPYWLGQTFVLARKKQ